MDEDEERREEPPFRWNAQAVFMLFFSMFAMAIPLMGVVWFLRGYLAPHRPPAAIAPAARANMEPLRQALEHVADVEFADETKVSASGEEAVVIHLPAGEVSPRIAAIGDLTKAAAGSMLEMTPPAAAVRRLVIRVPSLRADPLRQAIAGGKVDVASLPAGPETKLIEVELETP